MPVSPKLIDYTKMKSKLSAAKQALVDLRKMQAEMTRIAEALVEAEAETERERNLAHRLRQGLPALSGRPFQSEQEWRHWGEVLPDKKGRPAYGEAGPLPDYARMPSGVGRDPKGRINPKKTLENLLRRFGKLKDPKAK